MKSMSYLSSVKYPNITHTHTPFWPNLKVPIDAHTHGNPFLTLLSD